MAFKDIMNSVKDFTTENSPAILFGLGIASTIATIILVAKEAPEAKKRLEESHNEEYNELSKPKKVIEDVKIAGPVYVPAIISGTIAITALSTSFGINMHRNNLLAATLGVAERKCLEYDIYKDKASKMLGEKKSKQVEDQVIEEKMKKNPPEGEVMMAAGTGNQLFYDDVSGRYFISDRDTIHNAVKKLIDRQKYEDNIPISELYYEIGLPNVKYGDILFWTSDETIDVHMDRTIMAPNGQPAVIMECNFEPFWEKRGYPSYR